MIQKDEEIMPRTEKEIFQNDKNWPHIYTNVLIKLFKFIKSFPRKFT